MILHYNNVHVRLATSLDGSDTSVDFDAPLAEGGSNIATLGGGDIILLGCEDEVWALTAYTGGATTGTVTRGYGDTAAVPHDAGVRVANVVTKDDLGGTPTLIQTDDPPSVANATTTADSGAGTAGAASSVDNGTAFGVTSIFSGPADLVLWEVALNGTAVLSAKHDGTNPKFGAFGVTEVVRPTVTGSRGGNAALASLLSALDDLGWITDSSSA